MSLEMSRCLRPFPTPGSITAEEQIESIDAQKWTLSNGVTVIAKQTDFRDDEVELYGLQPRRTLAGGRRRPRFRSDSPPSWLPEAASARMTGWPWRSCWPARGSQVSPYIGELFEGLCRKRLA